MRILILNNIFPPHVLGGYEIACRRVAEGLIERGHTVEVLAGHAPMPAPDDPGWLHRVFSVRAFDPVVPHTGELIAAKTYEAGASQVPNTATLLQWLRRYKPDIVYAWHLWGIGGLALLDVCEQMQVPWLMHLMDCVPLYLTRDIAPLATSLFAGCRADLFSNGRYISMSDQIVREIEGSLEVAFRTRPEIVPGWVDTAGLRLRTAYSQSGVLRLVNAGALGTHKGTDLILGAASLLVQSGLRDFHIDIYGLGNAAPWLAMAADLGVSSYVSFQSARPQAELFALLPEYDAFLFPTQEREPFGFAALEAAACGVVPIVTRNAGVAERLVDGVHALKIDRSADSLAAAIGQLVRREIDPATIGRRAARLVRNDLNFSRCLDAIEAALSRVARPTPTVNRLDDPRIVATIFAKHALGQMLTAYP